MTWKGTTRSAEYRRAWEAALCYAKLMQVRKWLLDQREMNIFPSDFRWVVEDWFVRYQKAVETGGVWAIIPAANFFSSNQVRQEADRLQAQNMQFCRRYFEQTEAAWAWLAAQ